MSGEKFMRKSILWFISCFLFFAVVPCQAQEEEEFFEEEFGEEFLDEEFLDEEGFMDEEDSFLEGEEFGEDREGIGSRGGLLIENPLLTIDPRDS